MSRSIKKHPYIGVCGCKRNTIKKAKKGMTKKTRVELDNQEPVSGKFYKKLVSWMNWRPDDGNKLWDEPKGYRK